MREATPWERLDGVKYTLEAILESAVIWERQRIIKLLENEQLVTTNQNLMKNYDELVWQGVKEQLITLIKGEPINDK